MGGTLAANGGQPVCDPGDWPKWPVVGEGTIEKLRRVLESGRWTLSGPAKGGLAQEREFAARFAAYNGVTHCVPTVNGTTALMMAFQALGVGAGDEVIVPGLTWVSCATAVTDVNAIPVLVDIDHDSYCLSPARVEQAITPRTRAILAVHLFCSMADMDELRRIRERTGVPIVEDCAQSHGSKWRDAFAGSLGDIGMFSMHQGKPLTCGEGGAAITNDDRLAARMEQLRNNGRRSTDSAPRIGHAAREELGGIQGTNGVMSEFHAALLLDGLERLDEQIEIRQANAGYLDECLQEIPGVVPVRRPAQVTRQSYYHYERYPVSSGQSCFR